MRFCLRSQHEQGITSSNNSNYYSSRDPHNLVGIPMKQWWLNHALLLSHTPADLYSGNRKIIRRQTLVVPANAYAKAFELEDLGYTPAKMKMLERYYVHEESITIAQEAWAQRLVKRKFNSTCFTTYNHMVKAIKGGLRKPQMMGPCIQSVVLTLTDKQETEVDIFYRSTEFFKKFPADLIFIRDRLLNRFSFANAPIKSISMTFANVTIHPMYYPVLFPMLPNPVETMERLRKADPKFYRLCVSWAARYFLPKKYGKGIEKFSQARRTGERALAMLDKATIKEISSYVDKHYRPAKLEDPTDDAESDT